MHSILVLSRSGTQKDRNYGKSRLVHGYDGLKTDLNGYTEHHVFMFLALPESAWVKVA